MFRCPNCGNRLFGNATHHGSLVCPTCSTRLKVRVSRSGAPFFLIPLFMALWMFPLTGGLGFFWLFILFCCVIPGSRRNVEVIQESPSIVERASQTRGEQMRFPRAANQQTVTSGQHGVTQRQRASKYCSYCGSEISLPDWKFCANCGASLPSNVGEVHPLSKDLSAPAENRAEDCMVCHLKIHGYDQVAYCPHCGNAAHRAHLLEWIHVRKQCPLCGQHLTEQELL